MQHQVFKNDKISILYNNASKDWYVKDNENQGVVNVSSASNLSCLLQILHQDPQSFLRHLDERRNTIFLNQETFAPFPISKLIKFSIENRLFFWVELSLKWLKAIDIDVELDLAIRSLIAENKAPQHIRHALINSFKR